MSGPDTEETTSPVPLAPDREGDAPQMYLNVTLNLAAGQEWHSTPIYLMAGRPWRLSVRGSMRVYAGLFGSDHYNRLRQMHPFRFPFPLGTARFASDQDYNITGAGNFNVVVRASVFNQPGQVQVTGQYV